MNPVSLTILIIKVALCTLPFIAGLRLLFLSKETFMNFTSRLFGIADLEISHSTYVTVRIAGALMIAAGLALAYLFFWPESKPAPAQQTTTSYYQSAEATGRVTL